jgi:hypothetical protein
MPKPLAALLLWTLAGLIMFLLPMLPLSMGHQTALLLFAGLPFGVVVGLIHAAVLLGRRTKMEGKGEL